MNKDRLSHVETPKLNALYGLATVIVDALHKAGKIPIHLEDLAADYDDKLTEREGSSH